MTGHVAGLLKIEGSMTRFYLRTFGKPTLRDEHGRTVPLPERALVVIAYMMIEHRTEIARERLVSLFYGGTSPTALASFRKLVERVRRCAVEGWEIPLSFSNDTARLDPESISADFEVFAENAPPSQDRLRQIFELLQAQFLENAPLEGAHAWISIQQDRWLQRFRQVLLDTRAAAKSPEQQSLWKESAKLFLEYVPQDYEVAGTLVQIHRRTGDATRQNPAELRGAPGAGESLWPPSDLIPRLVLLPPDDEPGRSSLVHSLFEDITIGLCALRKVAVVAPHTAARIRSHPDRIAQLEKYRISYVVDAAMSSQGLYVQLVFLPTDSVLWAERFWLEAGDFFLHRKAMAEMIVRYISLQLHTSEEELADYRGDPEVYHSYLVGSQHLRHTSLQDVRRARRALYETLKLREDFAPALAALSRTYTWEWVLTASGDPAFLAKARDYALAAVAKAPELPMAHRELGMAWLYLGDVDHSLEVLDHAERLGPHLADTICGHGDALVHASQPAEGFAKAIKGLSLNPMPPDDYYWVAAGASYFLGHFQEAITWIERMSDPAPAQRLLAASYAMAGDLEQARHHRKRALQLNPYFELAKWLSMLPVKEQWQKELYREGLRKAGF
jgi:tetratricopeptide (TPR) repeat protein